MTSTNIPTVVLDTSVVSIIYNSDSRSEYYENQIKGRKSVISFQTLEELLFGPIKDDWGENRMTNLKRHIAQYEVIWPDAALVNISAQLRSERMKAGRGLKTADAWIAATAIMMNCPLVTDNGDFEGIPNLEIIKQSRGSGVQLRQPI